MTEQITEAGLRARKPKVTGVPANMNQTLNGFTVAQRDHPTRHRMPPAPFEEVEARRGSRRPCEFCGGTGSVRAHHPESDGINDEAEGCEICNETGMVGRERRPRNRRHGRARGR